MSYNVTLIFSYTSFRYDSTAPYKVISVENGTYSYSLENIPLDLLQGQGSSLYQSIALSPSKQSPR